MVMDNILNILHLNRCKFINTSFNRKSAIRLYLWTFAVLFVSVGSNYFFISMPMIDLLSPKDGSIFFTSSIMISLPLEQLGCVFNRISVISILLIIVSLAIVSLNLFRLGLVVLPAFL